MEDVYRSYYTKSDSIVSYMVQKLSVSEGMTVFEPCAGDGVFIDRLKDIEISIDAYELNPNAVELLKKKYEGNKKRKNHRWRYAHQCNAIFIFKYGGWVRQDNSEPSVWRMDRL